MPTQIKLYNSLRKQKEIFSPRRPGKVNLYHCGPTVYKRQHIGNMRRFLFADTVRRTLEYFGYVVTEVTNITDVGHLTQDDIEAGPDKLEQEAARTHLTPQTIATRETKTFFNDLKAINVQPSHYYPRATAHIQDMQNIIHSLLAKGFAYQTDLGVFYDITKFKSYGRLSGNTPEQLSQGARLNPHPGKKHPGDFALWLTNNPNQIQQWNSPWGRGYPGWHIECSAMSLHYLGSEIDIHTGGEDNKFPHHDNEIAQSEAATNKLFVRFWLHNAHLKIKGQKLAKRSGQQITLDTVTQQGFSALAFRLLVLSSHYRTKINFSWDKMTAVSENLKTIHRAIIRLLAISPVPRQPALNQADQPTIKKFSRFLADDLNTPGALAVFYGYLTQLNQRLDAGKIDQAQASVAWHTLMAIDHVLGVIAPSLNDNDATVPATVIKALKARETARRHNDFTTADKLRNKIASYGYHVQDTSAGPKLEKI